jgi:hypothetical protein
MRAMMGKGTSFTLNALTKWFTASETAATRLLETYLLISVATLGRMARRRLG